MDDLLGKLNQFRYEAKRPAGGAPQTGLVRRQPTGKHVVPEYEREDNEEPAKRPRLEKERKQRDENKSPLVLNQGTTSAKGNGSKGGGSEQKRAGSHWCRPSSFHSGSSSLQTPSIFFRGTSNKHQKEDEENMPKAMTVENEGTPSHDHRIDGECDEEDARTKGSDSAQNAHTRHSRDHECVIADDDETGSGDSKHHSKSAPQDSVCGGERADGKEDKQAALERTSSNGTRRKFDWTLRQIKESREGQVSTVDEFHRKLMEIRGAEGGDFLVLVAALLSVQCLDQVALKAFEKLRSELPGGLCVETVCRSTPEEIAPYISTVNYYKGKARKIWSCAGSLRRKHRGKVPSSQLALLELDGVGPKIAHLVQSVGLGVPSAGLVVDTHVHRVCGRLGWALSGRGATPETTRKALVSRQQRKEEWVAPAERIDFTLAVIGFGQTICTPLSPNCQGCPVRGACPSAFKVAEKKQQGLLRFASMEGQSKEKSAEAVDVEDGGRKPRSEEESRGRRGELGGKGSESGAAEDVVVLDEEEGGEGVAVEERGDRRSDLEVEDVDGEGREGREDARSADSSGEEVGRAERVEENEEEAARRGVAGEEEAKGKAGAGSEGGGARMAAEGERRGERGRGTATRRMSTDAVVVLDDDDGDGGDEDGEDGEEEMTPPEEVGDERGMESAGSLQSEARRGGRAGERDGSKGESEASCGARAAEDDVKRKQGADEDASGPTGASSQAGLEGAKQGFRHLPAAARRARLSLTSTKPR